MSTTPPSDFFRLGTVLQKDFYWAEMSCLLTHRELSIADCPLGTIPQKDCYCAEMVSFRALREFSIAQGSQPKLSGLLTRMCFPLAAECTRLAAECTSWPLSVPDTPSCYTQGSGPTHAQLVAPKGRTHSELWRAKGLQVLTFGTQRAYTFSTFPARFTARI